MSDETAHSLRGPSGAHRWRRCHGSINAERGRPEKVGIEAAAGSVFHKYAALCAEFGFEPEHFPVGTIHKQDGYEIEFDRDMQHYMHEGLDWIAERWEPGDVIVVERRVDISPWAGPGEFGTCDVAILKRAKLEIIIFDWKYGKGVPIDPVKNDQCYLYILGVWHDHAEAMFDGVDPQDIKVVMHVEQPRAPGGGGTWDTTMAEVLAEGKLIYEDALETMNPMAVRTPGEKQCQFCKASGDCPEQRDYLLNVFGKRFDEMADNAELGVPPTFKPAEQTSLEVRSYILLHWRAFKKYVDEIHKLTLHDLQAGRPVPLIKIVAGKPGRRFYRDPEAAKAKLIELLGEEKALEIKPIAPPVADKLLGKKEFKALGLTEQPPGKMQIVHQDDKRPALQDYASKFEDVEDEDGEE